jgi:predicted nucleic acid-binding protein
VRARPSGAARRNSAVLVDTSVWIDHFRHSNADLERFLEEGEVSIHPFVIGELACGSLRRRREIIDLMERLPRAPVATDREVMRFIESAELHGSGLGLIDVHLLASARLAHQSLWSADRRLRQAAVRLGLTG